MLLYHNLQGIGLGTIFAGIMVGFIVRGYKRVFEVIGQYFKQNND